jgi:hypothetical protein
LREDSFELFYEKISSRNHFVRHPVALLRRWNCILPEIPPPKFGVAQVLKIFGRLTHNDTNLTVVSVDWHKSSDFQPGFEGPHYSPGDHPDDYSWFVTYIYNDERTDKEWKGLSVRGRNYNRVAVKRIKDDGQVGLFIGVQ